MSRKQKEIQNQADQEHPKKRKKHLRKKDRVDQIIRIEELEELMSKAGDEVEVDFDSGKIYDRTKGTEYQGQAFPEFMQKLIAAGGLVNYTNHKKNK